jgi:hypothetical protein
VLNKSPLKTPRTGFTVPELVVALILSVPIAGAAMLLLTRQQQFFRDASARMTLVQRLRDGGSVMEFDLRGTSITGDTLRLMTDSAIEFYTPLGVAVVCDSVTDRVINLAPAILQSGTILTSFVSQPDTGDVLLVYSVADSITGTRFWLRNRIQTVTQTTANSACPVATGFTTTGDAGSPAFRITLTSPPARQVGRGASIRFVRRGRYSLYKSSDGDWYLGYRRCNAFGPGCSTIQPVTGPYRAYSSNAQSNSSGIAFSFFDFSGALVSNAEPTRVAIVRLVMRGELEATGQVQGRGLDSGLATFAPRE